jgi:DNA-binding transcriptional LysR family regulator
MKTGEVDLSIGFMPMLDADFHQQRLFDEDLVCIANADHPRIDKTLTLSHFSNENHLVVTTSGTGH